MGFEAVSVFSVRVLGLGYFEVVACKGRDLLWCGGVCAALRLLLSIVFFDHETAPRERTVSVDSRRTSLPYLGSLPYVLSCAEAFCSCCRSVDLFIFFSLFQSWSRAFIERQFW